MKRIEQARLRAGFRFQPRFSKKVGPPDFQKIVERPRCCYTFASVGVPSPMSSSVEAAVTSEAGVPLGDGIKDDLGRRE